MKRPHYFRLSLLLTACTLSFGSLRADVIVLKSGERLEGKVVSETDTTISLEYKLTAKIKDTKLIEKSEIKEMTRLTPSQAEFQEREIDKLLPTPDLLTAAAYESIIQDKLRTFVAKYPGTPEAAEAEKIIVTLGEEKEKVIQGQLKMEGQWLDANVVKRDNYNIQAYRLRLAMKAKAAEIKDDSYAAALRDFDLLRLNYPASVQYAAAVPEALDILDKYEKRLTLFETEQPILSKKREDGLKLVPAHELAATKASIDQEVQAFTESNANQKKNGIKWRSVYKYDSASIKDAQLSVTKERQELKAIDLPQLKKENETMSAVLRAVAGENDAEASRLFASISKDNLINKAAYANLEKEVHALNESAKKKRGQAAASTGGVTAPEKDAPSVATGTNALADALKKAQEDKIKNAEKKVAEEKKAAEEKAAAAPVVAPVEESSFLASINDYLLPIGGAIVVILLAAVFLGKRKKKDEE